MAEIVLATLNARYAHTAFGLRYLLANLGGLRDRATILEFDIATRTLDVVEAILAQGPKIVGLGVYIWNAAESLRVAQSLKRLRPDVTLVLGGPEVSHEIEQQEICAIADYVIPGEADLAFAELCRGVLGGNWPGEKIVCANPPCFDEAGFGEEVGSRQTSASSARLSSPKSVEPYAVGREGPLNSQSEIRNPQSPPPDPRHPTPDTRPLILPYDLYTAADLAHRVIYVEASRGCPFRCEFCLSSLDVPLRNVSLDRFLPAMQGLLDRGLRQFKFVDRTFNLNVSTSRAILEFFLERYTPGLFLHFEMIPDRLPETLREPIAKFPAGALQFEVGVQTFNAEVAERISRRQDNAKLEENLRWLRSSTGVHVHADLIAGLPGEDLASFAAGFDRLLALRPQEIQVGILKRLRGTPIVRHDAEWEMVYSPHPPYEILRNKLIDFPTMQRLRRFARYWDLIGNSGNFARGVELMTAGRSAFEVFWRLSEFIFGRAGRTHSISLRDLGEHVMAFAVGELRLDREKVAATLWEDYQRAGKSDRPAYLQGASTEAGVPRRQRRHLAT